MVNLHRGDWFWHLFRKDQLWVQLFFSFTPLIYQMKWSNTKLFADDTSLFAIVKDKSKSANILNNDLFLISRWAYNWKMLFNPDPSKSAQEVILSRKKQLQSHPTISPNNCHVERASYQKHCWIILDEKFNFS